MILNIITETIRLKENMGEISMKIGHGNEFLDLTKKAKISGTMSNQKGLYSKGNSKMK